MSGIHRLLRIDTGGMAAFAKAWCACGASFPRASRMRAASAYDAHERRDPPPYKCRRKIERDPAVPRVRNYVAPKVSDGTGCHCVICGVRATLSDIRCPNHADRCIRPACGGIADPETAGWRLDALGRPVLETVGRYCADCEVKNLNAYNVTAVMAAIYESASEDVVISVNVEETI